MNINGKTIQDGEQQQQNVGLHSMDPGFFTCLSTEQMDYRTSCVCQSYKQSVN